MADWRRETARDVGWGDWERQEAAAAERHMKIVSCPPGKHHMVSDRHGGGNCMHCGATVTADEI